jgi:serpin B
MLCSAVYFKGDWAAQFKRTATAPARFLVGPEQTVTASMMHLASEFVTAQTDTLNLLELPYVGNGLSMILLLPVDYAGLPALEQQFTPDNLRTWLQSLKGEKPQSILVSLPRFKVSQSFDLSRALKGMGMPSLLSERDSDLSGMSARKGLFVSEIAHEATIDVDEQGTEAAAANAVRVKGRSKPLAFAADHPFLYLIVEKRTGSILFLGRVVDPLKAY